ncbi:WD40-repeat-containing domain protein [Crepidotus variabilis]|uniref:WD40-repeat-containing domain protein n=1 Tax=Crepidotus variabilis TaxID=179855 RepID=A0A9P6JKP9_9AGAR|nr:WD40-repeat-containing domain protein [Crepidotus variabilis]
MDHSVSHNNFGEVDDGQGYNQQTLYIPVASPPTPVPSPGPQPVLHHYPYASSALPLHYNPLLALPSTSDSVLRRHLLRSVLASCTPSELLYISQTIAPLLKRDFLADLPAELSLLVLSYVDEPRTLCRAMRVSKRWYAIVRDESVWRMMCGVNEFGGLEVNEEFRREAEMKRKRYQDGLTGKDEEMDWTNAIGPTAPISFTSSNSSIHSSNPAFFTPKAFSWRRHFRTSYIVRTNWRHGGTLLNVHRLPILSSSTASTSLPPQPSNNNPANTIAAAASAFTSDTNGTVTSLALDSDYVVIGLANSNIKVYSAKTGVLVRTLVGHDSGVWGLCLVSRGGWLEGPRFCGHEDGGRSNRAADGGAERQWKGKEKEKEKETERTPSQDVVTLRKRVSRMSVGPESSRSRPSTPIPASVHIIQTTPSGNVRNGFSRFISPDMRFALGMDRDGFEIDEEEDYEYRSGVKEERGDVDDEGTIDCDERGGRDKLFQPDPSGSKSRDRYWAGKPSNLTFSSTGWGQPNSIVVSGGCDKALRVWDAKTGHCIYTLPGHTSTIRSLRTLHNRPIAVTGSRDATLRVWDVQKGKLLRVLEGHQGSVRCLDVCGSRVVSGSYDATCRVWDVDTGECLHVLAGHFHQIYSVAFDGVRVASGGLDTTVRVWDAETGQCIALLQGHTALVCQLQLSPTLLATGGSDGRVITFSLSSYAPLHRIAAHDSSVTALQFDNEFLVTGGNDGRVRLWDVKSGSYIREMCEPSESVWKVGFGGSGRDVLAIMCKRNGKTAVEIWSLRPKLTNGQGNNGSRKETVM